MLQREKNRGKQKMPPKTSRTLKGAAAARGEEEENMVTVKVLVALEVLEVWLLLWAVLLHLQVPLHPVSSAMFPKLTVLMSKDTGDASKEKVVVEAATERVERVDVEVDMEKVERAAKADLVDQVVLSALLVDQAPKLLPVAHQLVVLLQTLVPCWDL